jgi:putative sigma-54 modulation protein
MKLNIDKRKSEVSETVALAAQNKLNKLDRFFEDNAEAEVKFTDFRGRTEAEITVRSGSLYFRAEDRSGDAMTSLDNAIDSIVQQIRKHKSRLEKRLRDGAFERSIQDVSVPDEAGFEMLRRKHFALKPMTEEEAILQMELLNHEFYLFKNADEANKICVVYSRKDGGYGVLIAE